VSSRGGWNRVAKHIGIVACSAEGAALCYTTICTEAPALLGARHAHPEVSLHTHPFSDYVRLMEAGAWDGVAALMLSSEEKLVKAGAELIICPDNTIHRVFDKFQRIGIIGTTYTMEGPVYRENLGALGIDSMIPEPKDRQLINKIIFDELVAHRFTKEAREYFTGLIGEMADSGCDAVALACTEIPLIVSSESSPLPVLDSTRLLARAALRAALE
jgi:aspartate racemase